MTSTTSPTLLVMAAGLGSRYGGLKQLDPVGPGGETIIDYSIFDALRAGFSKVVFVIRKEFDAEFRATVGSRFSARIQVEYVFQKPGSGRTKPWGTAHAVLVAADSIDTPFVVINADDFYGAQSFRLLAQHFASNSGDDAMVAYPLCNTLSPFGSVSRGLCELDSHGYLRAIVERTRIAVDGGHIRNTDFDGDVMPLHGDELVSMNMWGFTPAIFRPLREFVARFMNEHSNDSVAEAFLPSFVNEQIAAGDARIRVLRTSAPWFGITYREDQPRVAASVRALIATGAYPERLS